MKTWTYQIEHGWHTVTSEKGEWMAVETNKERALDRAQARADQRGVMVRIEEAKS